MKLQALSLPADKRQRVDELRSAIRTSQYVAEATQGTARTQAAQELASLRHELLQPLKEGIAAGRPPDTALAQARAIVATGGAIVVPILTDSGSTIIVVADATSAGRLAEKNLASPQDLSLTVIDLPQLTTNRLDQLVRGDGKTDGWLGAYRINYLPDAEQIQRWPEWLAAIDGLGLQLWHVFGARLDTALKDLGLRTGARLVWMPSGSLGVLPLGLVQEPVSGRRLADDYEIVHAPSLDALAVAQKQIATTGEPTLAAIINPTGDLPGTEREGKIVASHFPVGMQIVLSRAAATPDAVLAALKGKSHWHFASHGTFSWEDARQSALVMHGTAPLSAGRLLQTDGLGRPRLVVLSACETGLHDIDRNPDEFIGLPGAFAALGAAGVLGTMWPVSDAATALLIAKFYELHMGAARLSPPTALHRAQTWLRQATNADLVTFARTAGRFGKLESSHAAEIEQELSEDGLTRSRNSALVEWITPEAGRASQPGKAVRLARPYAHPLFWAGSSTPACSLE